MHPVPALSPFSGFDLGSPLAVFAVGYLLCLATPGPNLVLIAGVALTRGVKGAVPVCLGVTTGSIVQGSALALAAALLPASGGWDRAGRIVGALLLFAVAWRVATARPREASAPVGTDCALGFGTAATNPVTGAFFASQVLTAQGAATAAGLVAALAIVGGAALLRSLLVAALVATPRLGLAAVLRAPAAPRVAGALLGLVAARALVAALDGAVP